jgi:hypothetical protein
VAEIFHSGVRAFLISLAISGIHPSIEKFGLIVTNTGAAILAWVGFGQVQM